LDGGGTVRVWEPPQPDEKPIVSGKERLSPPVLSADGKTLFALIGDEPTRVAHWSIMKGDALQMTFKELTQFQSIRPLAVGASGKAVIATRTAKGKETWLVSTETKPQLLHALLHSAEVKTALFRLAGPQVLTWDETGTAHLWNSDSGGRIGKAIPFPTAPLAFAIRSDGKAIVLGGEGNDKPGLAQVWSLEENGGRLSPALLHAEPVIDVSFEAGSTVIRTRDARHSVFRWEIATGRLMEISPLPERSRVVALSPSGDRHVVLDSDGVLKLYVGGDRAFVALSAAPTPEWRSARFSDDGQLLLTCWNDGLSLWDARTAIPLGPRLPFANAGDAIITGKGARRILAWNGMEAWHWRLPKLIPDRAEDWKLRLAARTGLTRDGDGPFQLLDARSWKQTRNEWDARKAIIEANP
jgi:WD40 repeat protein